MKNDKIYLSMSISLLALLAFLLTYAYLGLKATKYLIDLNEYDKDNLFTIILTFYGTTIGFVAVSALLSFNCYKLEKKNEKEDGRKIDN